MFLHACLAGAFLGPISVNSPHGALFIPWCSLLTHVYFTRSYLHIAFLSSHGPIDSLIPLKRIANQADVEKSFLTLIAAQGVRRTYKGRPYIVYLLYLGSSFC